MKKLIALFLLIPAIAFGQGNTNRVIFSNPNNQFTGTFTGAAMLASNNNFTATNSFSGTQLGTNSPTWKSFSDFFRFIAGHVEITADAQNLASNGFPGWGVRNNVDGIAEHYTLGSQFSIGNPSAIAPYKNMMFISSFHSNGISPGPDQGFSWEGQFTGDSGHNVHIPLALSPSNQWMKLYANLSGVGYGPTLFQVDFASGGMGITELTSTTSNSVAGPGLVGATNANITFTSPILDSSFVGTLLTFTTNAGSSYVITAVTSATKATIWSYSDRAASGVSFAADGYTYTKAASHGKSSGNGSPQTIVMSDGNILVLNGSNAKITLSAGSHPFSIEQFGTRLNIHDWVGYDYVFDGGVITVPVGFIGPITAATVALTATNAAPTGVTWGVTAPDRWLAVTNNGVAGFVPWFINH